MSAGLADLWRRPARDLVVKTSPISPELGSPSPRTGSNTAIRIVSALVLAPVAIAAAYYDGWAFACFWALAAIAVMWEWTSLVVGPSNLVFGAGASAIAAAAVVIERGRPIAAIMLIALGALASAIFAPAGRRAFVIGGVGYAGSLMLAPLVLRADAQWGLAAIVFLFGVVWTTDILGYFAGRAMGGPKLAPSISPKKTWSGAVAGALGAIIFAAVMARFISVDGAVLVACALVLSAVSQAGDLFESALKRMFGAKDASRLIPGHGGVMDRLDGFWAAALFGAIVGVARGGLESPARGLLLW